MREPVSHIWSFLIPAGAILKKDTVAHLRQTRSFVTLLLGVCGCSLVIYSAWPKSDYVPWSRVGDTAETVFNFFSFTALIGGALIVSGVAASAYISERERGIWDMLMITLTPTWSLVGAKFTSVLVAFGLMLIGCAPVVATLYFLIGIDPYRFIWNVVVILASLVAITSLVSGMSAWTRKATTALRFAYGIAFLNLGLYLVPIYLIAMVVQLLNPQTGLFNTWLMQTFFPATTPTYLLAKDAFRSLGMDDMGIYIGYQISLTLLGLFVAYAGVRRRRMVHESESSRPSRAADGVVLSRTSTRTPFTDRRNPVYVREWRWGLFPKKRGFWMWVITGSIASLLISVLFVVVIQLEQGFTGSGEEVMLASVYLHGLIVLFAVPASIGNILTKERENETGLLLATTTLSPQDIMMGKLKAAVRLGFLAWMVSFLSDLVLVGQLFLIGINPSRMVLGHITLLCCTICVAAITVYASAANRKTRGAVTLSVFLGFFAIIGFAFSLFLVIALLGGYAMINRYDEIFIGLFFVLSPIGAYFSLFEGPFNSGLLVWLSNIIYLAGITILFARMSRARIAKTLRNGFGQ